MYDDYYDDSMRLDEMLTSEDYNRFEEREIFRDQAADREAMKQEQVWELYGTEALCEWCNDKGHESVGEYLAATWDGDLLVCPVCDHEWVALPQDER